VLSGHERHTVPAVTLEKVSGGHAEQEPDPVAAFTQPLVQAWNKWMLESHA